MQKYLIAQPWYTRHDLLTQPIQSQIKDWQGLTWGIDKSWSFMKDNHVYGGLTSYNNPLANANKGIITAQFQNWKQQGVWSEGDAIRLGGLSRVEYNGGEAVAYADYYIRWLDVTTNKMWWMEARFFDDRGVMDDVFLFDTFTKEAIYTAEIGYSDYYDTAPHSQGLKTGVYNEWAYHGIVLTENNFKNMLVDMNDKLGTNYSENPNHHVMQAFGVTNELALSHLGGWNGAHFSNTFMNIEY